MKRFKDFLRKLYLRAFPWHHMAAYLRVRESELRRDFESIPAMSDLQREFKTFELESRLNELIRFLQAMGRYGRKNHCRSDRIVLRLDVALGRLLHTSKP